MGHLLFVTDHQFFAYNNLIYDKYVYDYNYFQDYLDVFDSITVVARVKEITTDQNLLLASGKRINFISLGDASGVWWLLRSKSIIRKKIPFLKNVDAICYRIPSIACYRVCSFLRGKPAVFEMVGDPVDSINSAGHSSIVRRLPEYLMGVLVRRNVKKIIFNSVAGSYVSNELIKKYPLDKNKKAFLISSIRLHEKDIKTECSHEPFARIRIIHVGSFIKLKNQQALIKLVKKLIDNGYDCHLTLVGSGPTDYKCFKMALNLGVYQNISFMGQVTGKEKIIELLDQNDFFIIPSLSEGKPRSLIEAMSRGLVCLGSARGGIKELLEPEFTFEPQDIDAIFRKILSILEKHDIRSIQQRNIQVASGYESTILRNRRVELLKKLI